LQLSVLCQNSDFYVWYRRFLLARDNINTVMNAEYKAKKVIHSSF